MQISTIGKEIKHIFIQRAAEKTNFVKAPLKNDEFRQKVVKNVNFIKGPQENANFVKGVVIITWISSKSRRKHTANYKKLYTYKQQHAYYSKYTF